MKRRWLALCLSALVLWPGAGESVRIFVRNREVQGRSVGSDIYLSKDQLARLFTGEELGKLSWGDNDQVSVGGEAAPAGPGVSLNWLAPRLGFNKRPSSAGIVDWVKQAASESTSSTPNADVSRRRPEYREAGRRLLSITRQLPPVGAGEQQARVERIGRKVADASPLRDLVWNFVVVHMDGPNAACTGEGHVFVTDSLLDMGISDDELAGVLGHEVAHGVRRHTFRRSDLLRDIMRLLQDFQTLQGRIDRGEDTPNLRSQISQYSRQRDQLQYKFDHERFYSHLDEEEADVLGLRYAVTAGFSADGLGDCLKRLEQVRVSQFGTAVLEDDMSHPPTRRRLEILIRARRNAGF